MAASAHQTVPDVALDETPILSIVSVEIREKLVVTRVHVPAGGSGVIAALLTVVVPLRQIRLRVVGPLAGSFTQHETWKAPVIPVTVGIVHVVPARAVAVFVCCTHDGPYLPSVLIHARVTLE
jgi:hypothetical protein